VAHQAGADEADMFLGHCGLLWAKSAAGGAG
jgi:hypothetical protein